MENDQNRTNLTLIIVLVAVIILISIMAITDHIIKKPSDKENNDDTVVEQKKDTSVDDNSVVYKSYKIGDQVALIDSSSWHVIKDTSTSEENVTLLKDDKIDTELKKDEIDNFLNTTYMKILKDNLSALSTDIKEIRLINTEDIKNITGLDTIELDTTIENVDWLYTEKT